MDVWGLNPERLGLCDQVRGQVG